MEQMKAMKIMVMAMVMVIVMVMVVKTAMIISTTRRKHKPGSVGAKRQFCVRNQAILHRYCKHPLQCVHLNLKS